MKQREVNYGFSLVEVMAALVVIAVGLAFLSLLFTQQRLNTINSQIRTDAVVFSQRILDHLRQKDPNTLPKAGTKECPPPTYAPQDDIDLCPSDISNSSTDLQEPKYQASITFSETKCKDNCREIKVEIIRDAAKIYTVETIYTKFE
jgi:prepilin-type N-terminal cleavage/methylation domain-containing protein